MEARYPRVLVLFSSPAQQDLLQRQVPENTIDIVGFTDPDEALDCLIQTEIEVLTAFEGPSDDYGLEWLEQATKIDSEAALALVLGQENDLEPAIDAVNRVGVKKLFTQPLDVLSFVEEIIHIAEQNEFDLKRDRKLILSTRKVTRLNDQVEQVHRALARKAQEVQELKRINAVVAMGGTRFSLPRPSPKKEEVPAPETAQVNTNQPAANDNAIPPHKVRELLLTIVRALDPDGENCVAARLCAGCARHLGWPTDEIRDIETAAYLHHSARILYPGERKIIPHKKPARHAEFIADRVALLPGMDRVAATIRHHHAIYKETHQDDLPRASRMLAVLSYFAEFLCDTELAELAKERDDPDLPLIYATESVLRQSGNALDPEFANACVLQLIPRVLERDEFSIAVGDAERKMVLSRTVYVSELALVTRGTALDAKSLQRIQSAADSGELSHVWITNESRPSKH